VAQPDSRLRTDDLAGQVFGVLQNHSWNVLQVLFS